MRVLAHLIRHVLGALVAPLLFHLSCSAFAHDIPSDVKVQVFLRPVGQQLQLLVRVPMSAMREIDFPIKGPGYLDLSRADSALKNAAKLWLADNIELYQGDVRLDYPQIVHARVSLPSDRSFRTYGEALAHITGPRLPSAVDLYWSHGVLDALLEYPIRADALDFSIRPQLARLGLQVVIGLRFETSGGVERALELHGDPGLVRLDPRWHQAFARFVQLGFLHILDGIDHLLFLLCLVIPFRRLSALVLIVTAFTVAHSLTLTASAFGYAPSALWFPPLVEALIALSIVYMALENIVGVRVRYRWVVAFAFGLVHGFGFAFALQETLQFAGSHLVTSLLAFNIGIELGQLLVLVVLVPVLELLFRYVVAERVGTIIVMAFVAHTGWHWLLERLTLLRKFPWPAWDASALASTMRWLMLMLIVAGFVWLLAGPLRQGMQNRRRRAAPTVIKKSDG